MTETARLLRIGEVEFEVVEDPLLEPRYVDYFTELRVDNGVVHITLAAGSNDIGVVNPPRMHIVARLRMPLATLANIQTGIEKLAEQLAAAKQAAN